ncbi:hypothetical protein BDM02DRAFT_3097466 [Thelephora ganbajun]|uniref:Uncharacterized protein n=1 Tax=Thelephora ganbajun TaxID=370292 RepID=A0ACB6ZE20_THEGA|nr:hypothetical protein BDM02DRAFT_3097466 [Thelephora ganbajun]
MKRQIQVEDSPEKPRKQQRLETSTREDAVGLTEALDFSALSSLQEISGRFDELARSLMFGHVIHLHMPGFPPKEIEYEILELEFYLHKRGCHADPFTHRAAEQKRSGQWYFHRTPTSTGVSATSYRGGSRKGMDLTFGSPVGPLPSSESETDSDSTRGGILLRTIRRVDNQKVISGPSRLVDEILAQSGAQSISDLVQSKWKGDTLAFSSAVPGSRPSLRIIPRKKHSATANLFRCPRIGLDLSHKSTVNSPRNPRITFVCKPYRYIVNPELLTFNGRPQTFIGVYDNLSESTGGNTAKLVKAIADVTGIQKPTVLTYIESFNLGLEGKRRLDGFIRAKTRSVADYLTMVGALRRQSSSVIVIESDSEVEQVNA